MQPWEDNEWLFLSSPRTLNGVHMYVLVEYCEEMNPPQGMYEITVTEDELDKYFYIDRRREYGDKNE